MDRGEETIETCSSIASLSTGRGREAQVLYMKHTISLTTEQIRLLSLATWSMAHSLVEKHDPEMKSHIDNLNDLYSELSLSYLANKEKEREINF